MISSDINGSSALSDEWAVKLVEVESDAKGIWQAVKPNSDKQAKRFTPVDLTFINDGFCFYWISPFLFYTHLIENESEDNLKLLHTVIWKNEDLNAN